MTCGTHVVCHTRPPPRDGFDENKRAISMRVCTRPRSVGRFGSKERAPIDRRRAPHRVCTRASIVSACSREAMPQHRLRASISSNS
jgi:hypothetical protein